LQLCARFAVFIILAVVNCSTIKAIWTKAIAAVWACHGRIQFNHETNQFDHAIHLLDKRTSIILNLWSLDGHRRHKKVQDITCSTTSFSPLTRAVKIR
jgi:hypothetical protein